MSAKPKQIEKRTSAERAEYMRNYHAARRGLRQRRAATIKAHPLSRETVLATWRRRYEYLGSVGAMWPERRHFHPESLEQTLQRVP
jgi:hypothetical protein